METFCEKEFAAELGEAQSSAKSGMKNLTPFEDILQQLRKMRDMKESQLKRGVLSSSEI